VSPSALPRAPEWIRERKLRLSELHGVKRLMRSHGLHTVCEEARCPNRGECFARGTATFLLLGDVCTRACGFCDIANGRPLPVDPMEPWRVRAAVQQMGLAFVVLTSVDRDDLEDGGAAHFAQAIRAIGEPIHSRTADQISMAKLLTLLFEITGLFDMKTRVELVLLQKTMVVVEGVARTLDPKLNVWTTSEPVVGAWIEQNLGPVGKLQDAGRAASTLARFAADLPSVLLRGENIVNQLEGMAENGFELSEGAIAKIGKAEARGARWGHIALWLIAALGLLILLR